METGVEDEDFSTGVNPGGLVKDFGVPKFPGTIGPLSLPLLIGAKPLPAVG